MTKKITAITKKVNPILEKYQIKRASIFGSFARGEENKNSDVDLLIEVGKIGGFILLGRLKMDLEKALKRRVDILTYRSISHLIEASILKDEIKIYAQR